MMNDTSGLTFETPLTRFDQVTQSWRTSQDTSLWDLPMSSPTLPASGSMRNGELFERPMLERPTSATGSSSLPTLATPNTMESLPVREGEAYEKAKRRGSGLSVREDSGNLREQVVHNLPTPRESMHKNQGGNDRGIGTSDDYNLETVAGRIATLPTPMTDSGRQSGECRDFGGDLLHGVTCENCKVVTLPTPLTTDWNTPASEWNPDRDRLQLRDISVMLPTPHAGLGERGRDGVILNPKGQQDLQHTLAHLMPTPAVNDMGAGKDPEQFEQWRLRQKSADGRTAVHGKSLYQEALKTEIAWGKYEPAIRRWENLTREVPEPTVPHKDKRRLNPAFVEWMMGLPAGHVTGHGLSAAKELKMLGNGVVPQQARSAVTQLMERITQ